MADRGTVVVERLRGHLANGSFSRALEESGRWNVVTIDVVPRLRRRPDRLVVMGIAALGLYWRDLALRRRSLRDVIWRTPTAMRVMREELLRGIAEAAVVPPFVTVQIQSMFDGHVPGAPHFVYTDHTHQANLDYPAFDPALLFARSWIDCEQQVYRHASRCFVRSHNVARSLERDYGIEPERVELVHAGPNARPVSGAVAQPQVSSDIVFVGVDWERKGGPCLVDAFARVRKDFPEATLTVIGCRPPARPGMRVVGRVPVDEVDRHLVAAGIFCLPTTVEPFGIAVIEAMARGLPVVATDVGAIPDIVEHGVNGILVPPQDAEQLAAALATFLRDPGLRRRAGERSREIAQERYTWEAVVHRVGRTLDEALAVTT